MLEFVGCVDRCWLNGNRALVHLDSILCCFGVLEFRCRLVGDLLCLVVCL